MRSAFDAACSLAGLIVLSPILIAAALIVKSTSRGPVFFFQERIGMGGRPFRLIKFRTMRLESGGPKITKSGDTRVTFAGKILRKTKIDELPQLVNVLKGDMALVGPRPEVPEYVAMDDPMWRSVLGVNPGLTDPVTLKLRNEEELLARAENPDCFYRGHLQRFKLEGYREYIEGRCFIGDLKIIFLTVASIFMPSLYPPPSMEEVDAGWKKERRIERE